MWLRKCGYGLIGGIIGGALVWIAQSGNISLSPTDLDYADLAAILLTAVAVIVAIFGGVLALAAVWGFKQLKEDAMEVAEQAGADEIKEQIENGRIRDYLVEEIGQLTEAEFNSARMDRRINRRIDAITYRNVGGDRELDWQDRNEGGDER